MQRRFTPRDQRFTGVALHASRSTNDVTGPSHFQDFRDLRQVSATVRRDDNEILKPDQWIKLINRLGEIDNPTVPVKASKYSVKDKPVSGD